MAPKQGDLITPTGRLVLPAGHIGDEQWLEFRRMRAEVPGKYCIGSSDVPSILNLPGVDTPVHVYRNKVKGIKTKVNEAMSWGHINEPGIATEWCRRNRVVIDEIGLVSREGTPWHQSTIDRRVRECPLGDGTEACLLEVKNMGAYVGSRWHVEIPDRVLAQILHQLYVTGYGHAHYACLIGGNEMKQGVVWADRERKVMDYVISEVERFRTEHLLAGVEPTWTEGKPEKMIALDEATHPERVGQLDLNGIGEVMDYARASRTASDAEAERKAQAAVLRGLADGKEFLTFSGEPAVRFGPTSRTNVDLDKLKEKYPEAYADPEVVTETKSHTIYVDKAYRIAKGK